MDNLPRGKGDPDRAAILALNERMRRSDLNNDLGDGLGYLAFNIPVADMRILLVRFPDLNCPDPEIKLNAWKKFARDPRSFRYKVRDGDGRKKPNHGIIVK